MIRNLDPLFGGLSREARILKLPVMVFVAWLMISTFLGLGLIMFVHWSVGMIFVMGLYGSLQYLTAKEDKGVSYYASAVMRKAKHHNKALDGVTYDPRKKNVKQLQFTYAPEAMKESTEAERLPFLHHITPEVIKMQNGDLMTSIKVKGVHYETEAYSQLALLKDYRNMMLMQLGERCVMYVHYIRKREKPAQYKPFKNPLTDRFMYGYINNINKRKRFTNDIYVTLLIRAKDPNGNFLSNLFKTETSDEKLLTELSTAKSILLSQLDRYEPQQLTVKKSDNGYEYCETLTFLSYILNIDDALIPFIAEDIRDYLSYTRKVFKANGNILFNKIDGENRIAGIFGVPTDGWAQGTDQQMLDPFLSLPHEMIISMSYAMMDREASKKIAKDKQGYLEAADDDAISQIVDIDQVRDDIASGKLLNGMFNMSLMVHSKDAEDFKQGVESVRKAFANNGIHPRKEDLIAEPAFYAQLPGNYRFNTRASVMNTLNFAGFASMHNSRIGQQFGNHWKDKTLGDGSKEPIAENPELGDHVLELLSKNNTPYYFNFHRADVGHTRIGAPTGGGKTVIVNALLTASTKFNPYIFHFDYMHSAAPFIRAMGGQHTEIMTSQKTNWNPLQLPDTPSNRAFLYEFLSFLASNKNSEGEAIELKATESKIINDVVERIYTLKPNLRQLTHIMPFFGIAEGDNLAQRLSRWVGNGAYAPLFDNETDAFSTDGARMFGFEMKSIIDNGDVLPAVLMYLLHRIDQAMTNRDPFIITFEEGQRLVQSPYLMRALKNLLTTIRRRNGMVIFITPTLEVLTKDEDLRQQFKTSIFFPNPKASEKTCCKEGGLGLSEKEYDWLTSTDPKTRQFIVKTDHDSVISRLDMTGMNDYLALFSGDDAKNAYISELQTTHGTDPNVWLPKFIEKFGQ